MRAAILISGSGSNMVRLVEDMQAGGHAKAVLVVSNRPDAGGLAKAAALGVPSVVIDHRGYGPGREGFEAALTQALEDARPDIILLAGFMRILSAEFVVHFESRMVNIHPSLLPKFRGVDTHARAIEAGETEHGATVHLVTPELDAGPILGRARLSIHTSDTAETLAHRVQALEHQLYPAVLRALAAGDGHLVEIDARDHG